MANTPQTISERDWDNLRNRAQKAAPPMFSREAIQRRKQAAEQQRKAGQS